MPRRRILDRMLRGAFAILVVAACAGPHPPPKTAHDYYVQALLEFQVEQWDDARRDFENSYLLQPDPSLLFDLGQANRHLGRYGEALQNYRDYLSALPDAKNRAEVQRLIIETKRLAKRR